MANGLLSSVYRHVLSLIIHSTYFYSTVVEKSVKIVFMVGLLLTDATVADEYGNYFHVRVSIC